MINIFFILINALFLACKTQADELSEHFLSHKLEVYAFKSNHFQLEDLNKLHGDEYLIVVTSKMFRNFCIDVSFRYLNYFNISLVPNFVNNIDNLLTDSSKRIFNVSSGVLSNVKVFFESNSDLEIPIGSCASRGCSIKRFVYDFALTNKTGLSEVLRNAKVVSESFFGFGVVVNNINIMPYNPSNISSINNLIDKDKKETYCANLYLWDCININKVTTGFALRTILSSYDLIITSKLFFGIDVWFMNARVYGSINYCDVINNFDTVKHPVFNFAPRFFYKNLNKDFSIDVTCTHGVNILWDIVFSRNIEHGIRFSLCISSEFYTYELNANQKNFKQGCLSSEISTKAYDNSAGADSLITSNKLLSNELMAPAIKISFGIGISVSD